MMGFGLPTSIQGWRQRSTQGEYQPLQSETALNLGARTERKPQRVEERTRLSLFEELTLPHLDAVHNLARWLMRNEDEAQEVVQETFLRALRYFDTYRGSDAKSWLFAILRNTCLTWRSRKRKSGAEPFDEGTHSPKSAVRDQEQRMIDAGHMVTLRRCIEMLPLDYREVLIMRELEEMSYRQISEVMAVPVGTVMSRLSRARRRLGECAAVMVMRKEQ